MVYKMYLLSCKINNSKLTIFTHRKTYKYMHTTFYGLSIHTDYVIQKKFKTTNLSNNPILIFPTQISN